MHNVPPVTAIDETRERSHRRETRRAECRSLTHHDNLRCLSASTPTGVPSAMIDRFASVEAALTDMLAHVCAHAGHQLSPSARTRAWIRMFGCPERDDSAGIVGTSRS